MTNLVSLAARLRQLERIRGVRWPIEQWDNAHTKGGPPKSGYIYFVRAGGNKGAPVKIGYTDHPDATKRVRDLQVGNPKRLELLCVIPGNLADERQLHLMFEMWKLEGEWFRGYAFGLHELIDELAAGLVP